MTHHFKGQNKIHTRGPGVPCKRLVCAQTRSFLRMPAHQPTRHTSKNCPALLLFVGVIASLSANLSLCTAQMPARTSPAHTLLHMSVLLDSLLQRMHHLWD